MPINNAFTDNIRLWDGTVTHYDNTAATTEPGERGVPYSTVWYSWVPDRNMNANITLNPASSAQSMGIAIWGQSSEGVDTLSNITLIRQVSGSSLMSVTFPARVGEVYYIQVGSTTASGLHAQGPFSLTCPIGRAPGSTPQGANDLPTFGGTAYPTGKARLIEAVGYGPESEKTVTVINLLAGDMHSDSTFAPRSQLVMNSNGSPSYSYERWMRLQFEPPFGAVTKVRFWVDNYTPGGGWELRYGVADSYVRPSRDPSSVAVFAVPTADPGVGNVSVEILGGTDQPYSPWLVLQAVWLGNPGPIQVAPLNFRFSWVEA